MFDQIADLDGTVQKAVLGMQMQMNEVVECHALPDQSCRQAVKAAAENKKTDIATFGKSAYRSAGNKCVTVAFSEQNRQACPGRQAAPIIGREAGGGYAAY
jgi:hypothetical protein